MSAGRRKYSGIEILLWVSFVIAAGIWIYNLLIRN
jgi:hypothetical protein